MTHHKASGRGTEGGHGAKEVVDQHQKELDDCGDDGCDYDDAEDSDMSGGDDVIIYDLEKRKGLNN